MSGGGKKRDALGIVGWAVGIALTVLFGLPGLIDMLGFETRGILAPFLADALAVLGILAPFGLFAGGFTVGWLLRRYFGKKALAAAENERDAAIAKAEAERDAAVAKAERDRDEAVARAEEERDGAIAAARSELEEKAAAMRAEVDGIGAELFKMRDERDSLARDKKQLLSERGKYEAEIKVLQGRRTETAAAPPAAQSRGSERREERERRRAEKERRAAAEEKRAAREPQGMQLKERMRERIESLDGEQVTLLATAYKYGVVEREYGTRDAVLLKGMAKLGLVTQDGVGAIAGTWKLTPACRRVMEEMERGDWGE